MISDELHNHKPYAVPVRFMPYRSITDDKIEAAGVAAGKCHEL